MIELTALVSDKPDVESDISKAWPAEPHYRGKPVFEAIYGYHGGFLKKNPGIEEAVQDTEYLPDSYQECYLGYVPSQDAFIIGFDAWEHEDEDGYGESSEPHYGVFKVKVHADGTMGTVKPLEAYGCQCFYGGPSKNYDRVRKDFPDIINMRLD